MTDQSEAPDPYVREAGGRFGKGNKGGPGRVRVRPLRDAITWDVERQLWEQHKALAQQDTEEGAKAREFCLRHANGSVVPQQPDLPPLPWKRIDSIDAIVAALPVVFDAHAEGTIDSTGLEFGVRLLERAANLLGLAASTRKTEGAMSEGQQQPYTIIVQAAVPPPTPQMQDGASR